MVRSALTVQEKAEIWRGVAGAAQGGEVLVSTLVHDLVALTGEFAFTEPRQVELKGIEGQQTVYPLIFE